MIIANPEKDTEVKMVEDQKDKGFAKDVETTLKEIELKVNRNNEDVIDKVTFKTSGGDITWKPKIAKTAYEGGFKVNKTVPMERDMLPKKMVELANITSDKGPVKLKICYNWWKTEQDGNPVTYRFIISEGVFGKWEILDNKDIKAEEVMP